MNCNGVLISYKLIVQMEMSEKNDCLFSGQTRIENCNDKTNKETIYWRKLELQNQKLTVQNNDGILYCTSFVAANQISGNTFTQFNGTQIETDAQAECTIGHLIVDNQQLNMQNVTEALSSFTHNYVGQQHRVNTPNLFITF